LCSFQSFFWQSREQYRTVWHFAQGFSGFSGSVSGALQLAHLFVGAEELDEASTWDSRRLLDIEAREGVGSEPGSDAESRASEGPSFASTGSSIGV
jgi:hypothetical protein